jgi:DNA-binding transcriptional MerR regulator
MQIGELARRVGTSTDTVRFYERSGWLPRATRRGNSYRDYGDDEVEHLRLLIELRRLGLPLADAATIAGWCHAGHCGDSTSALPGLLREQRADVANRIASLRELDARLERLERHISASRSLPVLGDGASGACCAAADAVLDGESACACCAPAH